LYRTLIVVRAALDDPLGPQLGEAERLLASPTAARADGPWASAIRLYRRHVARLAHQAGGTDDRFRRAGTHYWSVAMNRRVIGARERPSLWDEGTLLGCFSEEYNELIPQVDEAERRLRPGPDWAEHANDLIEALDATEFVTEPARELQEVLEEAMEAGTSSGRG
jgi:hypothetical protein